MAALSSSLKAGAMRREMMCGEPVLLARGTDGRVFALRDICPHRAAPLSAGRQRDGTVECPYHGWRFRPDGVCSLIPSAVSGDAIDPSRIRVRSYPVREHDGLVWVYMASSEQDAPSSDPPRVPIANAKPRWIET